MVPINRNVVLVAVLLAITCCSARRAVLSCGMVRNSFGQSGDVARTILSSPQYDETLELCRFSKHNETKRESCCSKETETAMLAESPQRFSQILHQQVNEMFSKLPDLKEHYKAMMTISKKMTEYELGSALTLHHSVGKDIVERLFLTLEKMLIQYDREESIFKAMDSLQDELLVYVVRKGFSESKKDFDQTYSDCVRTNRKYLDPPPFSNETESITTSLHYSALVAGFLQESLELVTHALNVTRSFKVSEHCYRDLVKINHCQKCYGQTQLRPCKEFCEDIFAVCLSSVISLDRNWNLHMEIMKILANYIFQKVDLSVILTKLPSELAASIDYAVREYPNYKSQLERVCGAPVFKKMHPPRLKIWEKPHHTNYGDSFTKDLQKLFVTLEDEFKGLYNNMPMRICAAEPDNIQRCWDGLTERVNKKKKILEFHDKFAAHPEKHPEIEHIKSEIKRIRNKVLEIFLPTQKQNSDDNGYEGSASGDSPIVDDNEPGDVTETTVADRSQFTHIKLNGQEQHEIVTSSSVGSANMENPKPYTVINPATVDTIDYVPNKDPASTPPSIVTSTEKPKGKAEKSTGDRSRASSSHLSITLYLLLTALYIK